jgi:hypothetical protein
MPAQQASELFALARGLAMSARRRGLTPQEAPAAIARSLLHLLADQPNLQEALVALVRRPACMALLAAEADALAPARQQLLDRGGVNTSAAIAGLEAAFVDGLREGWQQAAGPARSPGRDADAQEPDLRTWLVGLAAGVAVGAVLCWLALAALRVTAPQPQQASSGPALDPNKAASAGSTASLPPSSGMESAPAGLQACANLASPQSETQRLAAASNFGKRQPSDATGAAIPSSPALIVLHETVLDLPSTIALFQRNEPSDAAQASYHVLIGRNGERVRIVPDRERAFGAGDSAFGDLRFKTSVSNPPRSITSRCM